MRLVEYNSHQIQVFFCPVPFGSSDIRQRLRCFFNKHNLALEKERSMFPFQSQFQFSIELELLKDQFSNMFKETTKNRYLERFMKFYLIGSIIYNQAKLLFFLVYSFLWVILPSSSDASFVQSQISQLDVFILLQIQKQNPTLMLILGSFLFCQIELTCFWGTISSDNQEVFHVQTEYLSMLTYPFLL